MPVFRIGFLTVLTMLAFAGNSVLCRIALKHTQIDAASFTLIRLASGAIVLGLLGSIFRRRSAGKGNWISGFALFAYAACFSFAYLSLTAATGALLLFGAVQATMIGHGLWCGERFSKGQMLGLALAFGGLLGLLLPGFAAPPLLGAVLMLASGVAWGVYSLRGKNKANKATLGDDPIRVSAGNFLWATLFAMLFALLFAILSAVFMASWPHSYRNWDTAGIGYALASGAVASGMGYALWYTVLPTLKSSNAASIQLSVPVIAALGGIVLLGEALTMRFVVASFAILGGIALVISQKSHKNLAKIQQK